MFKMREIYFNHNNKGQRTNYLKHVVFYLDHTFLFHLDLSESARLFSGRPGVLLGCAKRAAGEGEKDEKVDSTIKTERRPEPKMSTPPE